MNELNEIRAQIRQITIDIIELVGKRTELARDIGKEKAKAGSTVIDRETEQHLREAVLKKAKEVLVDPKFALKLLNQLIMESIKTQDKVIRPIIPNAYTVLLKARTLEQTGKDIIHLEVGEPDFGPPERVVNALDAAVREGRTCYTESAGIPKIREKIADQLSRKYEIELSGENVVVTVGGRLSLALSIASRISHGDEVIIIDPSYPAYADIVRNASGRP
ncbi:MAG: aminotransferase class I/II-fold pyridoxal phosphate-dependent enzyme, partial [Candidatus Thorarchaeota archaeon]